MCTYSAAPSPKASDAVVEPTIVEPYNTTLSIQQKEESKGNEAQVSMIKGYQEKIKSELAKICEDILDVLDKHLIPSAAPCFRRIQGLQSQDDG